MFHQACQLHQINCILLSFIVIIIIYNRLPNPPRTHTHTHTPWFGLFYEEDYHHDDKVEMIRRFAKSEKICDPYEAPKINLKDQG